MNITSYKAARDLPRFVRDLLASPPRRGDGLNLWFYRLARVLHPFRTAAEIEQLLAAATVGQPVKRGEIERAVKRSAATAWQPGQHRSPAPAPIWPPVNAEQREAITARGIGLVDFWEISPIRFEGSAGHAEEIVNTLFPDNPLLCCAWNNDRFDTRPRDEWRKHLDALQFIVPSPMSKPRGLTQDGRESAHTLDNTGPRRFLVVEFDQGTVDEHAATRVSRKLSRRSRRNPLPNNATP
jgi:hypothetical protein